MLRLTELKHDDIKKIIEWNQDKSEDFLFQWAGKKVYKYPLTENQIEERQRNENVSIFAIEMDGKMVGIIELSVPDETKTSVRFGRLLIGEEYRGMGYGSRAIELIEEKTFNEYGVKCLELGVFEFNESAKKLYEKLGFKVIDINKDRMDSNWDSYTMSKNR